MDEITTEVVNVKIDPVDTKMMLRCIELPKAGAAQGEFPFAWLVGKDGVILSEATNRVARERDITRHAELVAVSDVMPEAFGQPTEVIIGLPAQEAEQVWRDWNPLIWTIIRRRGSFVAGPLEQWCAPPGKRIFLREVLSTLHN